ncbi:MAG: polyprenyl synthetase family protein [Lachnospiraceae bacterium]|nr:polyprenyl synthetase family protein [Lachnospiraceae bacterium]
MNFKEEQKKRIQKVEEILECYLPKEQGYQKTVMEAMNYSVRAGGKRLRPILMLETYRLFGGEGNEIEPFMAAMEMIHTYSLVHDDLPAMDNDSYRRGKKTTHIVYGHAMGILAGDALLNYAFQITGAAYHMLKEREVTGEIFLRQMEQILQAQGILAEKAGIYGMLGGQVVDVEATEKQSKLTEEQLQFIYRLKTGALIEGAMMIGAVMAGASKEEVAIVEQIAGKVGVAFQIQDDILDLISTAEVLGKPILSDEKNHKVTYVSLKGMVYSKEQVEQLSKEAIYLLEDLEEKQNRNNPFLRELLLWLIDREK